MGLFDGLVKNKHNKPITVVTLKTNVYKNSNGEYVIQKKIRRLKTKSSGFDFLEEDFSNTGGEYFDKMITNLYEVKDGTYEVIMCDEYRDYETGFIEDWSYKLIPYKE